MPPRPEPIAITGLGIVCAAGAGVEAYRRALAGGGLRPGLPGIEDRALEAASLAAGEALAHARLDAARTGVVAGTALGSIDAGGGVAGFADALAQRHGLGGPRATVSSTCASALYALEVACADLALGRADAVLCGGVDTVGRFMDAGFRSLGALSGGLILGEAAAFVALETLARARARGADVHAVIAGRGLSWDGLHITSPDETGAGMTTAIAAALAEARRGPRNIGRVTITAAGSSAYERLYESAFERMFGPPPRPHTVSSEPALGHVLAATAAVGLVDAALAVEPGRDALALTVGFGGQNGATLVRHPAGMDARLTVGYADAPDEVGHGRADAGADDDLEALFPRRWNPNRRIPDEARPLVRALADALERAGWWRPGSGEAVAGGLVVAVVGDASSAAASRFAHALLTGGPAAASAADFLGALPSTPASIAGILFGLADYQATLVGPGPAARRHALDQVRRGRLGRAVAASLAGGHAEAWCVEPGRILVGESIA